MLRANAQRVSDSPSLSLPAPQLMELRTEFALEVSALTGIEDFPISVMGRVRVCVMLEVLVFPEVFNLIPVST